MTPKTQISVYLSFKGNCSEAMRFYRDCLGGELNLLTVEESPMAALWPAKVQKLILHGSLVNKELRLLGSDIGEPATLRRGNTISLALACATEEEIKRYFSALSKGGKITHELHDFFDGTIGAFTDRYGMNWILKM